jgi:hypothetical protein
MLTVSQGAATLRDYMVRTKNDRLRLNLYFDNRVFEAIRRIAEARGTTYSEIIRIACRQYVLETGGKVVKETVTMKELTKPIHRSGD